VKGRPFRVIANTIFKTDGVLLAVQKRIHPLSIIVINTHRDMAKERGQDPEVITVAVPISPSQMVNDLQFLAILIFYYTVTLRIDDTTS